MDCSTGIVIGKIYQIVNEIEVPPVGLTVTEANSLYYGIIFYYGYKAFFMQYHYILTEIFYLVKSV